MCPDAHSEEPTAIAAASSPRPSATEQLKGPNTSSSELIPAPRMSSHIDVSSLKQRKFSLLLEEACMHRDKHNDFAEADSCESETSACQECIPVHGGLCRNRFS
eukprot:6108591-Pyramimonas_sp.AAC.2